MTQRLVLLLLAVLLAASASCVAAASPGAPLVLGIASAQTLNGVAGDYVTVAARIENTSDQAVSDVTTYLSLVNTADKLPVDLEDWSAEKGLYVGVIESGQALPLDWRIHFVKPGRFALTVVALVAGREMPAVSPVVYFRVEPKNSLDPGHILPVALGMPVVLGLLLLLLNYRRRTRP